MEWVSKNSSNQSIKQLQIRPNLHLLTFRLMIKQPSQDIIWTTT